jgi:hypothetical protein
MEGEDRDTDNRKEDGEDHGNGESDRGSMAFPIEGDDGKSDHGSMACTREEDHGCEEMEAQHVEERPVTERRVVEDDEEAALLMIMRRYRKNWFLGWL